MFQVSVRVKPVRLNLISNVVLRFFESYAREHLDLVECLVGDMRENDNDGALPAAASAYFTST